MGLLCLDSSRYISFLLKENFLGGGGPGILQMLPLEPRALGRSLLVCEMGLNSPGLATARDGPGTLAAWPFICAWQLLPRPSGSSCTQGESESGGQVRKLSGRKMGQHRQAGQVRSPVSQDLPASVPELVCQPQVTPATGLSYLKSTYPHRNCSH